MRNNKWTEHQCCAARKIAANLELEMINTFNLPMNPAHLCMALQAPAHFRNSMSKESTFPVIWDSGASLSVSPTKDDFVGPYYRS
jgi:hypothetical protein